MINRIYVEEDIMEHPRTRRILERFSSAQVFSCRRYAEVFNRKAQNFRLQKQDPGLILAKKEQNFVLPVPDYCKLGDRHEFYYFSQMLNCVYDCRYCYLQGMYDSAHYVVFINYEEFQESIRDTVDQAGEKGAYFFSGHVNDSLALDEITSFCDEFVPFFRDMPNAWMELRTKSVQVSPLTEREPTDSVVVAWSLSPQEVVSSLEKDTPSLESRLDAIDSLQEKGWPIGLRFDPVVYRDNFRDVYGAFFGEVFDHLRPDNLHSVTLGPFRLPREGYRSMRNMHPEEPLFAGPLEEDSGVVSYRNDLEDQMLSYCREKLLEFVPPERFYPAVGE